MSQLGLRSFSGPWTERQVGASQGRRVGWPQKVGTRRPTRKFPDTQSAVLSLPTMPELQFAMEQPN